MPKNGGNKLLTHLSHEGNNSDQISAQSETLLVRLKHLFKNMLTSIYVDIDNASDLIDSCIYAVGNELSFNKFISDSEQRFMAFQLIPNKTTYEEDSDSSNNTYHENLLDNTVLIASDTKYSSCVFYLQPDNMVNGLLSVIFIKTVPLLEEEKSMMSQIQFISLEGSLVESIYSVVSQSLNPLFRSYSKFVTSNQIPKNSNIPTEYMINKLCPNYPSIEKKFSELEFGLLHLQEEIQFVTVRLIRHPTIVKLLKRCNLPITVPSIDNIPELNSIDHATKIPQEEIDKLAKDDIILDSLQNYVNRWLNDIQKVIKIETDPPITNARQEISYWRQMNLSLNFVKHETKSPHVCATIEILKSGKRLKNVFAWKNGSNTSELLKLAISYNNFLEVLNYDQIMECHDIESLKSFVLCLFGNIRQIKNSLYPVSRLVKLIEAITKDMTDKILDIIIPQKLITSPKNEFDFTICQCFDIFMMWDDEYEKLHSVLREIFKQKREDSVKLFYKVNPYHRKLMDRIESVRKFRRLHEELQSVIIRISSLSNNFGNLFGEENTALEEIDNAWNIVVMTDYFDISKQGQDQWRASIARYDEKIDHIESKIASYLRDELGRANNSKEMFKIFSHFNALFVRPHIRGAIKEYQKQLLQHVNEDMSALMQKFKLQYAKSNACRINRIKDIPSVAGSILWTRQIDQQLKLILKKVFDVLGSDLENHVDGKRLKSEIETFRNQLGLQKMLDQWVKSTNEKHICIDGKLFHLQNHRMTDADDRIIKVYRISVNFTPDMITLAKEVRHMKAMGFRLPLSIINKAHQLSTIYPSAVSLIESLKTYENAILKLNHNKKLELLMCGYVNEMKNLILEGGTLIWESYKVEHYVRKFSEQATLIQEKIDDLMRILNKIDDYIQLLNSCNYLSGVFESHLHQIQQLVDEIMFQSYTNIDYFVDNIESAVEEVLLGRLGVALKNWSLSLFSFKSAGRKTHGSISYLNLPPPSHRHGSTSAEYRDNASVVALPSKGSYPDFKTIRLEFYITDQEIKLEPSIQHSRSYLISTLQQWIDVVLSHKRFRKHAFKGNFVQDYSLLEQDSTYRNLLSIFVQNNSILVEIFDQIDQLCATAAEFTHTWLNYQTLWDLPMESILQRVTSLDDWIELLQSIRESRMTVDTVDNYRFFGCIQIDYKAIQSKVNVKYDAWQKDLFSKFLRVIQDEMSSFFTTIQDAREVLQNKNIEISSTYEAVSIVNDVQMYRRNVCGWKSKVENFLVGEKILERGRQKFGSSWIRAETISSEWESFIQILKNRESIIQKQFVTLQLKVTEQASLHECHSNEILQDWHSNKPITGEINCDQALSKLKSYEKTLYDIENEKMQIIQAKEILDLTTFAGFGSSYRNDDEITAAIDELKSLNNVWLEVKKFEEAIGSVGEQLWLSVHPKKITNSLEKLYNDFTSLPSWIHQYEIYGVMSHKIKTLLKVNKILYELKSECIKERHWKQLVRNLKLSYPWSLPELTIQMIWDTNVDVNLQIYRDVITSAQGETALEEFLRHVKDYWECVPFETVDYKERFRVIKGWDELFSKLKEHLNSLTAMRHSPYFKMFEDETITWETKLTSLLSLLDTWVILQRRFIYLDGIFLGSGDIRVLLPKEYKQFHTINVEFTNIMKKIDKLKLVIRALAITGIQKTIEQLSDMLLNVQKSLGEYLEQERKSFPRFYFVGDEDLFEIIGNSKEIDCIQKHFKKMFAGISSITVNESNGSLSIVGVCSKENEVINLKESVSLTKYPNIHDWLKQLDRNMKHTLARLLAECISSVETNCKNLSDSDDLSNYYATLNQYPEQIAILVLQIQFCKHIENTLLNNFSFLVDKDSSLQNRHILHPLLENIQTQLSYLANSVLSEKTYLIRHKLESAITELVHQRDVVRALIEANIASLDHFLWVSQMRFYFNESSINSNDPTKCCVVIMADATFNYGFEYFGTIDRLVQTPLTDLCYLTMTQALKVKLGGSPFGPAGTGKTESVKALGCQLGRFVLVFNCDETFDFQAMGRIFTGLCQVGAWGCFDEFNRLEERMLSAVSQQIQTIQTALKNNLNTGKENNPKVDLLGKEITVNSDMAIFITMNPGYAGRSNLPDNLKKLFRSLSMCAPDRELISQVMLYSQGFKNAEKISQKIVPLFKLCKEQLSQQSHYDFGLRALKTVLVSAGSIKRTFVDINSDIEISDDNLCLRENQIILQSIHGTILPKLVSEDGMLFQSLLDGVFTGIKPLRSSLATLKNVIFEVCKERHLIYSKQSIDNENQSTNEWFEKIMQLYSISCVNHGIMLVGPSGSGKSSCWQVLLESLSRFESVDSVHHIIDPKAVSKDELYGVLDSNTREWVDGLFTSCLRKIINNVYGEMSKRHWIVFDGDVDPEWVENLNSTLDDNKLLTLPNGERLSLPSNVRIIFEVTDLKYATLATVSRCGMVFFNEDILSTNMIIGNMRCNVSNYLNNAEFDETTGGVPPIDSNEKGFSASPMEMLIEQVFHYLEPYFQLDGLIVETFKFAQHHLQHIMDFSRMRSLTTFFGLITQGIRNMYQFNQQNPGMSFSPDQINDYITRYMIWALLWSVGGDCDSENKSKICDFIESNSDIPLPSNCANSQNNMTLFDFTVNLEDCNWSMWNEQVPTFEMENKSVTSPDIVIPTVDTVRNNGILVALLNSHIPLILCGPPGSGKTMTLLNAVRSIPNVDIVNLNFSCATTSELIMKTFDQYCEYRRGANGTVLSPSNPRRWLVIFCDEINLPDFDKYGTQKVISFLRQLISKGGFYRKKDHCWVSLERILFVGACNPPTDLGRKPLPSRFLRHAPVFYVDYPGYESMLQIYGLLTKTMLVSLPQVHYHTESFVNAMVEFYFAVKNRFTSDMQPHYIFSPREMTRWIRGIHEFIRNSNDSQEISMECMVGIWAHEALRLFHDRLVLIEERSWIKSTINVVATKYFDQVNVESVIIEPILFSSWLSGNYEPVNLAELRSYLLARLRVYCEEETDVHLVLYDELIDFILRLDRIYHQPQGHALLVGVSGSGKTTVSKFVAWLNGMSVFQIRIHRHYTIHNFDDDLRHVLRRTGCKNEKVVFIIDESNVLDSSFIERTNTLLANGEVPGLFDGDEYNLLLSQIKDCVSQNESKMIDNPADLFRYFTENIIRNLHIVFTMCPTDNGLQDKSSASPALFNRCVINWFGEWSYSTLYNVGLDLLNTLNIDQPKNFAPPENFEPNLKIGDSVTLKHVIVDVMVQFHLSIQDINLKLKSNSKLTYALSPRQFLDFLAHYITMFNRKRENLENERIHLDVGLNKVKETLESVEKMKENLSAKRIELEAKNKLANDKLKLMFDQQKQAENKKQETTLIQTDLEQQTHQINTKQASVIDELSKVEPAIDEAKQAVSSISKKNLIELKSMSNPPPLVKMALESVCVMLGNPTTDWKEIRAFIIKEDFIQKVVNFSTENITTTIRETIEKNYLSKPEFNYEKINRASNACGPMVKWAVAQVYYAQMLQKVEPLREELKLLQTSLEESEGQLLQAKKTIDDLENSIAKYKEEYAMLVSDVQNIRNELTTTENRVQRSVSLISSLASERSRWAVSCENFSENLKTLPGDILLCSAFVVYGGYFDQGIRATLWNIWRCLLSAVNISCLPELSPSDYLSNMDEVMLWKSKGLPSDKLCIENVIMLKQYKRFPLIVDPSNQAYEFMIKHLDDRKVSVTSFLDESFQKCLEIAVRFGTTLFIMDVENFDPIVNPLLNMDVRRNAGRTLISIGANELDISPTFSLYLFCRDPWFEVPSDLASRVTLVNFTITPKSLQNQCLDMVLKSQRPDVEAKREDLGKMQGEFQSILRNLEKKLLDALNDAHGSLLDNDCVIETLERLKKEAADISLKVAETDRTIREVELTTNLYLPLSVACSCIYFTLDSMNSIHPLYHYNLKFFLSIYQSVLDECITNKNNLSHIHRLDLISKKLFTMVNNRVSKGLLHEHRIVFSLQLGLVWLKTIKKNTTFEKIFQHYLSMESASIPSDRKQFPSILHQYIKKDSEIEYLSRIEHSGIFYNFFESMTAEVTSLKNWLSNSNISQPLPNIFHLENEEFTDQFVYNKLCQQLLIQALKPELLVASSHQLVESIFGNEGRISDINLYNIVFDEVNAATPILLCSVAGYDASSWVDDLVSTYSTQHNLKLISIAMGSMEGYTLAENAIGKASKDGLWVMLKNVHLAKGWLKNVEKKLHSVKLHPKFRLFMTCEIQPDIPKNIIRISRVLTFEPPPGIKANLVQTFSGLCAARVFKEPIERCRLYFLLAWLHAVIMERLRYIPLGWSKAYEFNESDFRVACDVIDSWVDDYSKRRTNLAPSKIPWEAIRSIFSRCIYGGRLDNIFDKKILDGFINSVFKVESFEDNFYLVDKNSAKIKVPDCRSLKEYVDWINITIPENECPEWLNLPANAETLLSIYKGSQIRINLLKLQLMELDSKVSLPSSQPKSKQSVTSLEHEIQPSKLVKIPLVVSPWLDRLPSSISTLPGTTSHLVNPIYRFYERELRQAKRLLSLVRSNLENVISICNGNKKKTNTLELVIDCIVQDSIPDHWKSYEIPKTLSLNSWICDLTNRLKQFANIFTVVSSKPLETIHSIPVWLGGFFAPEAYLTATRQYVAQQKHLSLEKLKLQVDFNASHDRDDIEHAYYFIVEKSFIFGGKIVGEYCQISDEIYSEISPWKFTWKVKAPSQIDHGIVQLPVYLNETRSQLLYTLVALKDKCEDSNYYNRGIAITLCNYST